MSTAGNRKSFRTRFNMTTGCTDEIPVIKRHLSQMRGMYNDSASFDTLLAKDPLVYQFYNITVEEKSSDLIYGTSIIFPGKVGNEYFMTKGHFHTVLDTAESYFCFSGNGYMLMENQKGDVEYQEFKPGVAVYVPAGYAHRSINISDTDPLVTFFNFRADAGHDYGTIEAKGFRKLFIEEKGRLRIIDNPKWKER